MATIPRALPFYALAHGDAVLRQHHLRRRRAELARTGAPWRCRAAVLAALLASRVEVTAFSLLAHQLEGGAR
jgi:hypothetical protein